MKLTPGQEAAYALDYGLNRADLKPPVQTEYDRLLEQRKTATTARPVAGAPGSSPLAATWQGSPASPWWRNWPGLTLGAAWLGFVTAFIVGAHGGSDMGDAANLTAATLFLLSLGAALVAIPAALYRRYRSKRTVMERQSQVAPFAPCYRCGYPRAVHSGDDLKCPEGGLCYRCGGPFTEHVGYELTCPVPSSP